MSTHVRSPKHSQGSAIEVLGSPDHGCGTVCPLNCDNKTFVSPSLGGYLRHFCSLRLGALWLLCLNGAGYKHSYLLTYFLTNRGANNGFNLVCLCVTTTFMCSPVTNFWHCLHGSPSGPSLHGCSRLRESQFWCALPGLCSSVEISQKIQMSC